MVIRMSIHESTLLLRNAVQGMLREVVMVDACNAPTTISIWSRCLDTNGHEVTTSIHGTPGSRPVRAMMYTNCMLCVAIATAVHSIDTMVPTDTSDTQ